MTTNTDFYETEAAQQLATAYNTANNSNKNLDLFFLICLFLTLNI